MKRGLFWIGAAALLALAARTGAAGGGAQIAFWPQSVDASAGATVAVDVTVANVDPSPGLAAYDLTLAFDPAVLRLDDFSDSGFITSGENVVICVTGKIDNAGGSADATCTAIPLFDAPGVSTTDPVALLHASFTALAAGTSPLTLSGSLSDPAGTAIPASFGSGTIHVTAVSAAASPTAAIPATPSPASQPAVSATANQTPPANATPVASTPTRTPRAAVAGTPRAPETGNGGGGTSPRTWAALLAAGAAAIAITGALLAGWRLRGKKRPNGS